MSFRFERLEVWLKARLFAVETYRIASKFPKTELFGLTDQIKRAAVSVALNIAEGSDRKSDKEFVRYLRMAIGSLEEVVTALYIARDLEYIDENGFVPLYQEANVLVSKLNALINSFKKR